MSELYGSAESYLMKINKLDSLLKTQETALKASSDERTLYSLNQSKLCLNETRIRYVRYLELEITILGNKICESMEKIEESIPDDI